MDIDKMKGANNSYRPKAGDACLISGPHMDNDDGFVFGEFKVLWCDSIFLCYQKVNCWPVVGKWEHVIAKQIKQIDR